MNNEFKKTISKDQTVYTLESASGGATSSGSIASVSTALGGVQRRPKDSIFAQEGNKETAKPRNFVAKNAKMGGAGAHKDKKKAVKQGDVKHKSRELEVAEGWKDEADDFSEWSNHVKDALLSVGPSQQYGMAQRLSQIERKHFGSDIQTGFNAQTGKPDSTSSKDLTGTVSQIYSAIKSGALASAAPTAPGTQSTAFGTVTKPAGQPDPYHTSPALAGGDRQAALARLKGDSNYPAATTLRGPSSGSIKILRNEEDWEEALNNQDSGDDGPTTAAGVGAAMAKLPSWKVMLATIMLASKLPVIGDKIKNTIISSIKNEFGVQMSFKEALGYMQHVRTTPPEEIVSPAVWKFERDGGDYETAIEQLPDDDVNVSPAHVMATISNDLISSGVAQEIKPGKEEKPVAEAMGGGVDAKGRTQDQWMKLVKAKFPDAKMHQAKMIDGPCQAILSDGRKLYWNKVEQGVAEGSEQDYQVGDEVLWRNSDPMSKMMPLPGTVLAIAPGKVKLKIYSKRLIQDRGTDTVILNLANYNLTPKRGVAEGIPDVDHMPGPIIKRTQTGCKRCHGKGYVYKTDDGEVHPMNRPDAKKYKCGKCDGIGFVKVAEQGVAEDHEIQMASSELQSIAKNAQALLHMVRKYSEQEGLDAWQQSKITKAADYLNAVLQSVSGEQNPLESVGVPSYGVGGARNRGDDERHDLDDVELQRNRQEVSSYNITINGKPINPKPIFGRSATIAWGKEQAAAGMDLSNAMISPVQYTEDAYMESLTNMLERSVSQAQHNLMVGVAHNPAFAQKVKVKQKVGQEFANADQGHDISKLPIRVPKKK